MNKINESNKEKCITVLDEVFNSFDFKRVKEVMDVLNWKWGSLNNNKNGHVPDIEEIERVAADLMWRCANEDIDCISTGGFRVEKDFYDNDPWMRLSFEVTEYSVSHSEL